METNMADKIGINREIAILGQILGVWRPIFEELDITTSKCHKPFNILLCLDNSHHMLKYALVFACALY